MIAIAFFTEAVPEPLPRTGEHPPPQIPHIAGDWVV
jgi:hypothetical protein